MADKAELLQAIDDAILDADSLEQFVNGSDSETVLTRLSAEYPTLQKALKELFENGGIAGRFKTLVDLQASDLVDGDYALVADDTDDKNGIYIKEGGVWVKSKYSPTKLDILRGGDLAAFDNAIKTDRWITSGGTIEAANGKDWTIFTANVKAGETYYYKAVNTASSLHHTAYPNRIIVRDNGGKNILSTGSGILVGDNVYRIDIPNNPDAAQLHMNLKVDSNLDIRDSFSFQKDFFDESRVGVVDRIIGSIDGLKLDPSAVSGKKTRLDGETIIVFGDSLTEGNTNGNKYTTYTKIIANMTGASVINKGNSGSNAARLVDNVTSGQFPRRDGQSKDYVWGANDFGSAKAVVIMIGTNDVSQFSFLGSVDNIPSDHVSDHENEADYWATFQNQYVTNIALCIEFIRSKNKSIEVYLVKPPYSHSDPSQIERTHEHLDALGRYYSVPVLNATHESGLSIKGMHNTKNIYSYDGTHLNQTGNDILGRFIASKLISMG